jgi:hypothetical protein
MHLQPTRMAHSYLQMHDVGDKGNYTPGAKFEMGVHPSLEVCHSLFALNIRQMANQSQLNGDTYPNRQA